MTLLSASFLSVCYFTFTYNSEYHPVPQAWYDNINAKCEAKKVSKVNSWFYNGGILKISLFSSLIGGYFGLVFDSYFLKGTRPNLNETSLGISLLRAVVVFAMGAGFIAPYFLMDISAHSLFYLCIIQNGVPFFFLTLFMFGGMRPILQKIGLARKN